MSIGKTLQEARVKKGFSVQQAHVATRIKSEYIEALESEMQEYEEWPGAKPKPLDPLKVLEED